MGSYAKYQERMRRAREQMKRRKTVNIGKEVMTGMYIYITQLNTSFIIFQTLYR